MSTRTDPNPQEITVFSFLETFVAWWKCQNLGRKLAIVTIACVLTGRREIAALPRSNLRAEKLS